MAEVGRLEMLLNPLSLHRSLKHPRYSYKLKATICCSSSDTGKLKQLGVSKPAIRSSRGRTRKSLGLDEAQPISPQQPAQTNSLASTIAQDSERENYRLSAERESDAATPLHNLQNKDYGGMPKSHGQKQSITNSVEDFEAKYAMDWEKRNKPPAQVTGGHSSESGNQKWTREQIQDLINADLEQRFGSDDDSEGEDPLFIEEDDPNWLDEPDEGWGYKVSDIFKEGFGVKDCKRYTDDDDVSDVPEFNWDYQPDNFFALDVDSMNWSETVFGDPSPLVALIYDRYGKKGRECYHVLRELEDAANRMWETKRLPPRLIKINAAFEEDLVGAIGIKEYPTLLFVKGGKLIHYQSGYLTADDLLKIISYFYHGAARPPCLKKVSLEDKSLKV